MARRAHGARFCALAGMLALTACGVANALPAERVADEPDRAVLRVRNRTPFILNLYVAGVRIGWVRPFRSKLIKGLRRGYHRLYASSRYGSAHWGPSKTWVPGNWNLTPTSGSVSGDTNTALVSRIYRRNSATLNACDKLAHRRGERLDGRRAEFEVIIDKKGTGVTRVTGSHISGRLRSCYLAVTKRWAYPETGESYRVAFQHMHARSRN